MAPTFGTLSLTPTSIRVRGRLLSLTPRQYAVLRVLIETQAAGDRDLTTRRELNAALADLYPHGPNDCDIRTLLCAIRKRLNLAKAGIHIKTEINVGYRLVKSGAA